MAKIGEKAQVSMPSDREVLVRRAFAAPRALVWKAHVTPALMQRWMLGPPGWTMPVCEMDVRVGGAYRYRWRSIEDGKEFGFHGTFTDVVEAAKLAHTEFYDPGDVGGDMGEGADIVLTFEDIDGGTLLTSRMDFKTQAARDAAVSTGMTDGMEMSYATLDDELRR
ncbi:MAG: hypothetical protein GC206_07510 [Alphaproteobacteria bacterium]|nr:hypothetical protein [Alphaproteobacteria bacterium]